MWPTLRVVSRIAKFLASNAKKLNEAKSYNIAATLLKPTHQPHGG